MVSVTHIHVFTSGHLCTNIHVAGKHVRDFSTAFLTPVTRGLATVARRQKTVQLHNERNIYRGNFSITVLLINNVLGCRL